MKAKHTKKPPLVEVYWWDAVDRFEQFTLETAVKQELTYRCSAGYLLFRDDKRTIIAHDWDEPDEVGNVTVIPSGWVERINYAKKPSKATAAPKAPAANESLPE